MSTVTFTHPSPLFAAVRHLFARWTQARQVPAERSMTRQEEAAELRAMATDVARSDPRFAQDLYAAADRHAALGGF